MDYQERPNIRSGEINEKRDIQLDAYRALVMMYIVCVIHTVYWFELFNEYVRSAILFEMPLIFFIAGASQQLARPKNTWQMIKNRTKRLLRPYYIWVAVLLIFLAGLTWLGFTQIGKWTYNIHHLTLTDYLKILLTGGSDHIPFYGYTWFISTYFIISCTFPFQNKLIHLLPKNFYPILLLFICIFANFIHPPVLERELKNIIFYNFFYIIGFLYYKKFSKNTIFILSITAFIMLLSIIFFADPMPMQDHKFPADIIFLLFGISMITIISFFISNIKIKKSMIIDLWNQQGYVIYIYQTILFTIVYAITYNWIENIAPACIKYIIIATIVFIVATLFALFYKKLSKTVDNYVRNHVDKLSLIHNRHRHEPAKEDKI